MFETRSRTIYELVRDGGRVPLDQLDLLDAEHRRSGRPLADLLVERGLIDRAGLLQRIAESLGCGCELDPPWTVAADVAGRMPAPLARACTAVPLRERAGRLELLVGDPFNPRLAEDLTFALGDVRLMVAEPARVEALLQQCYGGDGVGLDELLREADVGQPPADEAEELSIDDLEVLAGQAPIVRFVNLVLGRAIQEQASDVHFEPFERELKIRCRVDGVLHETASPPRSLALAITSRLKVLADLNIAERRRPQDGRMKLTLAGRPVDLRVSTLPTQFGESVVLRVLDQSAVQLELGQLGMPDDVERGVRASVKRPNGIIVVTGPTGSGKTTTLYSALRTINTTDLKLLTAEDPVEYEIEGIMQVPVNPAVGLTFASALRSFLRQDPDVIMIGEIRDLETAQIAIQAALTGHLVLSTLHTNDAAGAVTRLIDMGVEPFLIAATLEGVLAQRLVRRICPRCREVCALTESSRRQLHLEDTSEAARRDVFRGRGCGHCGRTGYQGRHGIFEWLPITEPIRELIAAGTATAAIRQRAVDAGMRTLRDDGLRAAFAGTTTVEEVVRYT